MKTIDEYMKISYRMEITEDSAEGGYVASYPDLKGCITCGPTIKATAAALADAKKRIDDYIFFYNNPRIQTKTKLTPLELRRQFVA